MKIYSNQTVAKPIIYLSGGHTSGADGQEKKWIKRTGCKFRCFSFAYTCPGAFYYNKRMHRSLDNSMEAGVGVMMDSGAASFHKFAETRAGGQVSSKKSGKHKLSLTEEDVVVLRNKTIAQYLDYCAENHKDWDFYVTFDYTKHCPTIRKITERMDKHGLDEVVPVYHGDMGLEWFERYCKEGRKIIGIGIDYSIKNRSSWKGKRYYYDMLFDIAEKYGTKLHGLAVTSLSLMFQYPWYSVDSATWVKTAAYGKIIYIDSVTNVMPQIHVSKRPSQHNPSYNNLPKELQKRIRQTVEDYGFDFDKVREDQHERSGYNASLFNKHMHKLKEAVEAKVVSWENLI